jgi:hypothetical protein
LVGLRCLTTSTISGCTGAVPNAGKFCNSPFSKSPSEAIIMREDYDDSTPNNKINIVALHLFDIIEFWPTTIPVPGVSSSGVDCCSNKWAMNNSAAACV